VHARGTAGTVSRARWGLVGESACPQRAFN
jgi:hypothetical protein